MSPWHKGILTWPLCHFDFDTVPVVAPCDPSSSADDQASGEHLPLPTKPLIDHGQALCSPAGDERDHAPSAVVKLSGLDMRLTLIGTEPITWTNYMTIFQHIPFP